MPPQGTASLLFALATAVTVIAQTPSAQDEAMPLLRDVARIALRNVRIVDGTGAPARQNQTLIIERGQIRAIGNAADERPGRIRRLPLSGRESLAAPRAAGSRIRRSQWQRAQPRAQHLLSGSRGQLRVERRERTTDSRSRDRRALLQGPSRRRGPGSSECSRPVP